MPRKTHRVNVGLLGKIYIYIQSVHKAVRRAGVSKQAEGSGTRVGPEVNLARGGWKQMHGNLHRIGNHPDGFTYLIDPMASMFIRRATPIHIYSTQKTMHRRKGQGSEKGRESEQDPKATWGESVEIRCLA
jgi:hypothetical protein